MKNSIFILIALFFITSIFAQESKINFGGKWVKIYPDEPSPIYNKKHLNAIKCTDSLNCIVAGSRGPARQPYFLQTTDGGKNWYPLIKDSLPEFNGLNLKDLIIFDDYLIALGQIIKMEGNWGSILGRFLKYSFVNGTYEKIEKNLDSAYDLEDLVMVNERVGFAYSFWGKIYRTEDAGLSWEQVNINVEEFGMDFLTGIYSYNNKVYVSLIKIPNGAISEYNAIVLQSDDYLNTVKKDIIMLPMDSAGFCKVVTDKIIWAYGYHKLKSGNDAEFMIFKSIDGGKTWELLYKRPIGFNVLVGNSFLLDEETIIFFSNYDRKIYTYDGGKTFAETTEFYPNKITKFGPNKLIGVDGEYIYVLGETETSTISYDLIDRGIIHLYPNPASDYIEIAVPAEQIAGDIQQVRIYNMLGQCIVNYELRSTNNEAKAKIDVKHLPAGLYYIRIGGKGLPFIKN